MAIVPPPLGPAGWPLAVAGGLFWAGIMTRRLVKANKRDLHLDEYYIYFCKGKACKIAFAQAITKMARDHIAAA